MDKIDLIIVGGTGYVGRNVINQVLSKFSSQYNIRALVRRPNVFKSADITELQGELPDNIPEGLFTSSPNILIHLGTKNIDNDNSGFFDVNVRGTINLMDALPPSTLGVIYSSSFSVYGQESLHMVRETAPLNPQTPLALSRSQAEEAILNSARKMLRFVLRPRFIIGKDDTATLPRQIKMYQKGISIGSGNQEATYIDVVDYADIILELASYISKHPDEKKAKALNVGYDNPLSLRQLHQVFSEVLGHKRQIYIPISEKLVNVVKKLKFGPVFNLVTMLELGALSHCADTTEVKKYVNAEVIEKNPYEVIKNILKCGQ